MENLIDCVNIWIKNQNHPFQAAIPHNELSKSQLFPASVIKSRFSFKVTQDGQQQLYLQYKVCCVLYKIVGAPSFHNTNCA